ncbi:hypothetical protein EVAR_101080_1 [Eumeta japonica]|uniref:Uncharacterized protein n=1 Tax=Eumeta variegata TaxID=151549 RepID=A0A4C2AD95_EUMVA|nr:hypothetical protein EVAR_101080_1 [Eumeta japonica]
MDYNPVPSASRPTFWTIPLHVAAHTDPFKYSRCRSDIINSKTVTISTCYSLDGNVKAAVHFGTKFFMACYTDGSFEDYRAGNLQNNMRTEMAGLWIVLQTWFLRDATSVRITVDYNSMNTCFDNEGDSDICSDESDDGDELDFV